MRMYCDSFDFISMKNSILFAQRHIHYPDEVWRPPNRFIHYIYRFKLLSCVTYRRFICMWMQCQDDNPNSIKKRFINLLFSLSCVQKIYLISFRVCLSAPLANKNSICTAQTRKIIIIISLQIPKQIIMKTFLFTQKNVELLSFRFCFFFLIFWI